MAGIGATEGRGRHWRSARHVLIAGVLVRLASGLTRDQTPGAPKAEGTALPRPGAHVEPVAAEKMGRETVTYVSNVDKYYIANTLVQSEYEERLQTKQASPGRASRTSGR